MEVNDYKHVLLATDLHEDCQPVIDSAVALAKRNKAKLSVVHVIPSIPYYMASGMPSIADLEEQLEQESQENLEKLKKQIGVEAEIHLLHGSPTREIINLSKEIKSDLIITGSHGRHGVELLIGSTANGILQRADCDVLMIRLKNN